MKQGGVMENLNRANKCIGHLKAIFGFFLRVKELGVLLCAILSFNNAQAFVMAAANYQPAPKEILGIKLPENFTLFNKIGAQPPMVLKSLTLIIPGTKPFNLPSLSNPSPSQAEVQAYKQAARSELILVWLGVDKNKKPLGFSVYFENTASAPASLFSPNGVSLKDSKGNVFETVYPISSTATLVRLPEDKHFKPVFLLGGKTGLQPSEMDWLVVNGLVKAAPMNVGGQLYAEIL